MTLSVLLLITSIPATSLTVFANSSDDFDIFKITLTWDESPSDLDEDGKPIRKPIPEDTFIDIAIDHGLASPDTADKTYRKALGKMKKKLKKKNIL